MPTKAAALEFVRLKQVLLSTLLRLLRATRPAVNARARKRKEGLGPGEYTES